MVAGLTLMAVWPAIDFEPTGAAVETWLSTRQRKMCLFRSVWSPDSTCSRPRNPITNSPYLSTRITINFNIKNIHRADGPGKLTMGVAQSRWLNHAYADDKEFQGQPPNDELRAVFTMHPEPLTVVARAGSGIKTIMDLRGKRVNIGNPGSLQRDAMNVLMAELGWDTSTFSEISELDPHANATGGVADSRLNASAELCENKVDAIVFAEANPNPYIREASYFCDVVLVDVSGPAVDKLVADHYYYVATTIPGETYLGTPNDTKTFGAVATLMSSLFVKPDVIYEAVKAVFENFDEFKALDPAFENLTKEVMVNEGIQVPLHGGADKYLREVKLR